MHIDLFADDTKIYFSYICESERFLLQNNLKLFSQWAIQYYIIKMYSYNYRKGYSI